jgi:hypothetical protein
MHLTVRFTSLDQTYHESNIDIDEKILTSKSEYFKSMINFQKYQSSISEENILIDLTSTKYLYNPEDINKIFELIRSFYICKNDKSSVTVKQPPSVNIIFNHPDNKVYSIKIDTSNFYNIQIDNIYKLHHLSIFFDIKAITELIEEFMMNYYEFLSSYSNNKDTQIFTHSEFIITYSNIRDISEKKLQKYIFDTEKTYVMQDFINNIPNIYLYYKEIDDLAQFNEFINIIDNKNTEPLVINHEDIISMDVYDSYYLLKNCKNLINLDNKLLKLSYFTDILKYDNYPNISNINIFHNYELNKTCTKDFILPDILSDLYWSNMIIAGGYIFSMINNLNDSIINSTDIDIFIYGDTEEIRNNKQLYLLEYFSKYSPIYSKKGFAITVIIFDQEYDIQIIKTDDSNPYDIISKFDFNYVKMLYDGSDVLITYDCLVALKYAIAIFNHHEKVKPDRLYKTILKGLNIKMSEKLFIADYCYETGILRGEGEDEDYSGYKIDVQKLSESLEIKLSLNKSKIIRKLQKCLNTESDNMYEIIPMIKSYYNSTNVDTSIERLLNINKKSDNGDDNGDDDGDDDYKYIEFNPDMIKSYQKLKLQNRGINIIKLMTENYDKIDITIKTDMCDVVNITKHFIRIIPDESLKNKIDSLVHKLNDLNLRSKSSDKIFKYVSFSGGLLLYMTNTGVYENEEMEEEEDYAGDTYIYNCIKININQELYERLKIYQTESLKLKMKIGAFVWSSGCNCGIKFNLIDILKISGEQNSLKRINRGISRRSPSPKKSYKKLV